MGPLVGGCRMLLSGEPGEWDSRGPRATAAPSGAMSGILALLGSARGPSQTPTTGSTFCKAWEVSLEPPLPQRVCDSRSELWAPRDTQMNVGAGVPEALGAGRGDPGVRVCSGPSPAL